MLMRVVCRFTGYRIAQIPGTGSIWAAALRYKVFNDTVKGFAIVIALLHQLDEILNGARSILRIQLKGKLCPVLHCYCSMVYHVHSSYFIL